MEKILISSCLLGEKVRYDGKIISCTDPLLKKWKDEGRLIPFCPEVASGLPIPRDPVEIQANAKVLTADSTDLTANLIDGANQALELAKLHNIKIAILKERSPSCASQEIYDGSFSGTIISGSGITATKLRENGIEVFSEEQLDLVRDLERSLSR